MAGYGRARGIGVDIRAAASYRRISQIDQIEQIDQISITDYIKRYYGKPF